MKPRNFLCIKIREHGQDEVESFPISEEYVSSTCPVNRKPILNLFFLGKLKYSFAYVCIYVE